MKLRGVPVRQVLRLMLEGAAYPDSTGLVIEPDSELRVLRVVSAEKQRVVDRTYSISDVLTRIPADELLTLMQETVDPDSWRDNGGSIGDARLTGRTFHVRQSLAAQDKVAALLAILREVRDNRRVAQERVVVELDAALNRPVNLRLDGLSWREALERAADAAGVNLFFHEPSLEAAGADLSGRAVLPSTKLTFWQVAQAARAHAREGDEVERLQFARDGNVLWVAEPGVVHRFADTRVYDVRPHLASLRENPHGLRAGRELMEYLIAIIQETVEPDSWRDNGGSVGAIRDFHGSTLVVTQTLENHRRVTDLLRQFLRK